MRIFTILPFLLLLWSASSYGAAIQNQKVWAKKDLSNVTGAVLNGGLNASQNLQLNGHYLSYDGSSSLGLRITEGGDVEVEGLRLNPSGDDISFTSIEAGAARALFNAPDILNCKVTADTSVDGLSVSLVSANEAVPTPQDPCHISFEANGSANHWSGDPIDLTIPPGATLGTEDGIEAVIYVYAVDSNSAPIAVSHGVPLAESAAFTHDVVAVSTDADSTGVLYGAATDAFEPVRLLARIKIVSATAGDWENAALTIENVPFKSEVEERIIYVPPSAGDSHAGLYILDNATWDPVNRDFNRIDESKPAIADNWRARTNIPFEAATGGHIRWVAAAAANPINDTYAHAEGWNLATATTQYKDFVVGGFGIEVDGNAVLPYGRFGHTTWSQGQMTGIFTNLYLDGSDVDDDSENFSFFGIENDDALRFYVGDAAETTDEELDLVWGINNDGSHVGIQWYVNAYITGANPSLGGGSVTSYAEITDSGLTLTPISGSASIGAVCSSTNAATAASTDPTTCAAGDEGLGFAVAIPSDGAYEICMQFSHVVQGDSGEALEAAFEIVRTATNAQTVLEEGGARISSELYVQTISSGVNGLVGHPYNLCGIFNVTEGTHAFRLMYEQTPTGTLNANVIRADASANVGQRNVHIRARRY